MQSFLIGLILALGWRYVLGLAAFFGIAILLGEYFPHFILAVAGLLLVGGLWPVRKVDKPVTDKDDKPVSEQWQRMLDYRKRKEAERKRESDEVLVVRLENDEVANVSVRLAGPQDDKPVSEQWQRMLDYRKRKEAERRKA